MTTITTSSHPSPPDLSVFLDRYATTLRSVFRDRAEAARLHLTSGMPPQMLRELLACGPLATFIPERFGGRGGHVREGLAVLEASAYESLAMALTVGINGALFLQPLAKYGRDEIKGEVFERFVRHQNMGGLMMTEPDHGSDALNMRTSHVPEGDGHRIRGVKHWAGLTGLADYWLVTARARGEGDRLERDIDFFVCDAHDPEQAIQVEERFENAGLRMIPYGRNRIDVRVPDTHRLVPKRTGLTMMLDLLHRSRMQFPGMAVGLLRRIMDEALAHVRQRDVGGKSLLHYDQVRRRLARMQASFTVASAMSVHAAEHAGVDQDLSKAGIQANAIKAVVTDLMQEASQSLLQLVGAKGYRFDHIAWRSIADTRPFQIFEGSNDILYEQLADAMLKAMRRGEHATLHAFLASFDGTARAAERVRDAADFRLDGELSQRRTVDLGRALGRIVAMEHVIDLGDRGFHRDLVANALEQVRLEVNALLGTVRDGARTDVVEDEVAGGAWLACLAPGRTA
jgi:alkylation response protein AidB-like acyl-CoA dehydrogenase